MFGFVLLFSLLILIPVCAILNHLGGQSTTIPYPRVTCRMVAQGSTLGTAAWILGFGADKAFVLGCAGIIGMTLWAVTKWGPGFMALKTSKQDKRDYTTSKIGTNYWITKATDKIMGVSRLTTLSVAGIHRWGMIYMFFHGALMYPLFIFLAIYLTPSAIFIGLLCLFQGEIYRRCNTVFQADYFVGALIGLMFSLVLVACLIPA